MSSYHDKHDKHDELEIRADLQKRLAAARDELHSSEMLIGEYQVFIGEVAAIGDLLMAATAPGSLAEVSESSLHRLGWMLERTATRVLNEPRPNLTRERS